MAVGFVAFEGAAGLGAVTPGMPTGATTGDLLILTIEGEGEDANADNPPTGGAWTAIGTGTVASNTAGSADNTRLSAYWAWYDAGINRTVPDAGNHTLAVISAWRGVDATTPFDGVTPVWSSSGTNSTSFSVTGVTGASAGAAIVAVTTAGDNDAAAGAYPATVGFSGWTNANLSGLAEVVDVGSNAGSDGSIGIAYGVLVAGGSSGATTGTVGASEEQANVCFALRDAATADDYFTFDGNDSLITDRAGYLDDFDVRIDFSLDDWTPADVQPLLVEGNTTTRNWKVQIGTAGEIGFTLFGIADYAGDAPTLQDFSGRVQIRITRVQSTGVITYYNRAPGTDLSVNTGWTELGGGDLGSTSNAPNNGSIKLRIGHDDNDAVFLSGKVYQVWIEQTIDGTTPLYDPDFRTTTQGDWSSLPVTDDAGNSWNVGTGSPVYSGAGSHELGVTTAATGAASFDLDAIVNASASMTGSGSATLTATQTHESSTTAAGAAAFGGEALQMRQVHHLVGSIPYG